MDKYNENRLDGLLIRWAESHEHGEDVSAQELCRDCPHLADELARRIEALKEMSWLDKPIIVMQNQAERQSRSATSILAGRYRLDEMIAEGGYAHVWKGFDRELERVVAIKVPKLSRLGSVEEFMAEARKVAKLDHPNIVPIYDVGRDGDSCFLVFPFVRGGNFADLMRQQPVPPFEAARLVAEVAEALDYAHQQGFVHRDIKPRNILLDHNSRALLTDFGIAVSAGEAGVSSLGTLAYMSPEQIEGTFDFLSDLYALGVVLHQLLTGKLPYSSNNPMVLRREIIAGSITLGMPSNTSNIPFWSSLDQICRKALKRVPAARHSSARKMASDLRRIPLIKWDLLDTFGIRNYIESKKAEEEMAANFNIIEDN